MHKAINKNPTLITLRYLLATKVQTKKRIKPSGQLPSRTARMRGGNGSKWIKREKELNERTHSRALPPSTHGSIERDSPKALAEASLAITIPSPFAAGERHRRQEASSSHFPRRIVRQKL